MLVYSVEIDKYECYDFFVAKACLDVIVLWTNLLQVLLRMKLLRFRGDIDDERKSKDKKEFNLGDVMHAHFIPKMYQALNMRMPHPLFLKIVSMTSLNLCFYFSS